MPFLKYYLFLFSFSVCCGFAAANSHDPSKHMSKLLNSLSKTPKLKKLS